MQVSQQSDSITHASVGSQQTTEMGVSDSAALMHILSTALYTYPKLAAMREIMCNGWDANISNNTTHIPLMVTVSETHVSVKDSGKGIPHEKIGEIYGMYGNSTKRDDSTVTGGFGLGSKAPFAYVDNFEVINCNGGVKAIYRVSKSSMQKGGKPAIATVVTLPTEESGITVKFALKQGDRDNFIKLIQEIAALGEISVQLNDGNEPLPIIPLSQSETGYVITTFRPTIHSPIMVRYGNVVYPVPIADGYSAEWSRVHEGMASLWSRTCIIFNCPPDAVSIQPSREALILTEGTIKTLRELLGKFDTKIIKQSRIIIQNFYTEGLNEAIKRAPTNIGVYTKPGRHSESFTIEYGISKKRLNHLGYSELGTVDFSLRNAALRFQSQNVNANTPSTVVRHKLIDHIIREGNYNSSEIKYYKALLHWDKAKWRFAQNVRRGNYTDNKGGKFPMVDGVSIYSRHVLAPFMEKFNANPMLKRERLTFPNRRWGSHGECRLMSKFSSNLYGIEDKDWYQLYQPKVFIYSSVRYLKNAMYGTVFGTMAYLVKHNDKDKEDIIKFFTDLGYDVRVHVAEPKVREIQTREVDPNAPMPEPKKSPKRKGYLSLRSSLDIEGNFLLNTAREVCTNHPEQEVKKPIAWVILNTKKGGANKLPGVNSELSHLIYKLWGDKIAVVTSVQATKLEKEGVLNVQKYVYAHVDSVLSQSKDFPRYLAFGLHLGASRRQRRESLIFNMLGHKTLMDELGLRYYISMETQTFTQFFEEDPWLMPLCQAMANKIKPSPEVQYLSERLKDSPWFRYVNCMAIGNALDLYGPDHPQTAVPYEIVRKLLK